MREMKDSAISLIAIVRYHFFFYLTNFLPLLFQWIADNNIQQQSFRSRNTRQLFNFLFIEPTKDTRTPSFTFGSKNNMGSCKLHQPGEMLVFHFTSQKRSNIGRFLPLPGYVRVHPSQTYSYQARQQPSLLCGKVLCP